MPRGNVAGKQHTSGENRSADKGAEARRELLIGEFLPGRLEAKLDQPRFAKRARSIFRLAARKSRRGGKATDEISRALSAVAHTCGRGSRIR